MAEWVENLHPRQPGGSAKGGEFAPKGASSGKKQGGWVLDAGDYATMGRYHPIGSNAEWVAFEDAAKSRELTPDEETVITNYASFEDVYIPLNKSLRAGGGKVPADWRGGIERMDSAIASSKLPQDVMLYRGVVGKAAEVLNTLEPGKTVLKDFGFMSTSMGSGSALDASQYLGKRGAMMKILADKGTEALPIIGGEVLFPRGTQMDFLGVDQEDKSYVLKVRPTKATVETTGAAPAKPAPAAAPAPAPAKTGQRPELLQGQSLADVLPPEAHTEAGAEKLFYKKLKAMPTPTFYHESPGDVADSMRKEGIKGGYGVFATINETSNFVSSPVKTVVTFTIPKDQLGDVSPDMIYGIEEGDLGQHGKPLAAMSPFQQLLYENPDLKGASISTNLEVVPPAWIKSINVVKSAAPVKGAKAAPVLPGAEKVGAGGWNAASSTFTAEQATQLHDRIEARQEDVNDRSMGLEGTPEDNPKVAKVQREFDALECIKTVAANNQRALANPELMQKSLFLYDSANPDQVKAALHMTVEGDVADLKWLGSVKPGAGKVLFEKAKAAAIEAGATKIEGMAKFGSLPYYEKLGFVKTGEKNWLTEAVPIELKLKGR